MRYAVPALILVALMVFLALGLRRDPREVPSPLIGKPAPEFTLPGLHGEPARVTKADLLGRPLLVNFFASWCAGCLVEHPILMRLSSQGIEIVGLDYKDTDEAGAAWLRRHGNPYRTVITDAEGSAGLDWGVYGVPETYLLNARGEIVYKHIGPLTEEAWRTKMAAHFDSAATTAAAATP